MKNQEAAEMVKKMSPKEKRAYIWYYYKFYFLGALILIAVAAYYIHGAITKPVEYYNITYIDNYTTDADLTAARKKINKIVLNNDKKKFITLSSIINGAGNTVSSGQLKQVLVAKIAVGEIDMAIVNQNYFDQNFSSGLFYNLKSLNGFSSLKNSNYEFLDKTNSSGQIGTYGIYINKNNKLLSKLTPSDDNKSILVIMNTSKRKDKAVNMLKTMLNN